MATIDDKAIVDRLIANNGVYVDSSGNSFSEDPPAIKVVSYINAWGVLTYGVVFEGEDPDRYNEETAYVRNPRTVWERS